MHMNHSQCVQTKTILPLAVYANQAAVDAALLFVDTKNWADCVVSIIPEDASDITSVEITHGQAADGSDTASIVPLVTNPNKPDNAPTMLAADMTDGLECRGALHCMPLDNIIGADVVVAGAVTMGIYLRGYNRKYTEHSTAEPRDVYAFEFFG